MSAAVAAVRMARSLSRTLALAACVLLGSLACGGNESLDVPAHRLSGEFVTGDAAARAGRTLRIFRGGRAPGQLTEREARRIGVRFVRDMAPWLISHWRTFGVRIDSTTLRACGRALYAADPYLSITGNASALTRRAFGPHWVVPVCAGSELRMVVAFSALAIELAAAPDDAPPPWDLADVSWDGVSPAVAAWMYNPEQVMAYVARTTGRRVASVPELVMSPRPESPMLIRWRVKLESPVTLVGARTGERRDRSTVFVGFGTQLSEYGVQDLPTVGPNVGSKEDAAITSWPDPLTKAQVHLILSPLAPTGLEMLRRPNP